MLISKYGRKAVALVAVLAVALIGATAVGLWAGAAGPASTDPALVDPAEAMDLDGGVCMADPLGDVGPATPPDAGRVGAFPCCPALCHGFARPGCCCICNGLLVCSNE